MKRSSSAMRPLHIAASSGVAPLASFASLPRPPARRISQKFPDTCSGQSLGHNHSEVAEGVSKKAEFLQHLAPTIVPPGRFARAVVFPTM